jgi:hypothetical protein
MDVFNLSFDKLRLFLIQLQTRPDLRHVGVSMSEEKIVNQIVNGGGRTPGGLVNKDRAEVLAK